MGATPTALLNRWAFFRDQVREHKREIARHRRELQAAATELTRIEAEAERLGLALIDRSPGVGDIHGHPAEPHA
jgi:hypothetical protein